MQISEIIERIKRYSRGLDNKENPIDDLTTRDQILFGTADKECTGIVTTCFASVDVIEKAHALGANLIIPHEALFYNHGDHTDWLEEEQNSVYLRKKKLLEEYDITVWRDHDYIHSGVNDGNGGWFDGIFKGFLHYTGLENNYHPADNTIIQYQGMPILLDFPEGITVNELAHKIIDGAELNGLRVIGDLGSVIHSAAIPMHILGFQDNELISTINKENIDCLITMELIDYTVNEYMRDGAMLKDPKAILAVGHFNLEEPGMKYMLTWLPKALGEVSFKCNYIQSGDMNRFVEK